MLSRKRVIKDASSETVLNLVEKCKGGGKVALPVAIVIVGFLNKDYDEMLQDLAATEGMKIVDYAAIAKFMSYIEPEAIETEWKRQINEAMMNYQGAIILRHFGDNMLTRGNMIKAAKTGMKNAKVIILRLGVDSVKGFVYHQEKYHERFARESQVVISENIIYKSVSMNEGFNYYVEMA